MQNYCLQYGVWDGNNTGVAAIGQIGRARLDIVRGSTTIFSVCCSNSKLNSDSVVASNAEIVLIPGDVIKIVEICNWFQLETRIFASVIVQPFN
jgi:hypothetical protein